MNQSHLRLSGVPVPKDVMWLILRNVIEDCLPQGVDYGEQGVDCGEYYTTGNPFSACLDPLAWENDAEEGYFCTELADTLKQLSCVCKAFRLVLKAKCVWLDNGSTFLFRKGSFD